MSSDQINRRKPRQLTDEAWMNILRTVLSGDQFPRNSDSIPENIIGSLGNSASRFSELYALSILLYGGSSFLKRIALVSPSLVSSLSFLLPTDQQSGTSGGGWYCDSSGNMSLIPFTKQSMTSNYSLSSSCGNSTNPDPGGTATITNCSVSFTATGRPIFVGLVPDQSGSLSYLSSDGTYTSARFFLYRDATIIFQTNVLTRIGSNNFRLPVGLVRAIDIPAAGSYTYTAKFVSLGGAGTSVKCLNAKLLVREI